MVVKCGCGHKMTVNLVNIVLLAVKDIRWIWNLAHNNDRDIPYGFSSDLCILHEMCMRPIGLLLEALSDILRGTIQGLSEASILRGSRGPDPRRNLVAGVHNVLDPRRNLNEMNNIFC